MDSSVHRSSGVDNSTDNPMQITVRIARTAVSNSTDSPMQIAVRIADPAVYNSMFQRTNSRVKIKISVFTF